MADSRDMCFDNLIGEVFYSSDTENTLFKLTVAITTMEYVMEENMKIYNSLPPTAFEKDAELMSKMNSIIQDDKHAYEELIRARDYLIMVSN